MSELRIRIEPTDPQGPQAMSLLREAAFEARRLYRRIDVGVPLRQFIDSNAPMPVNPPIPARGAYFIAFLGNDLVGSGALRPLDETTVEVRRMYSFVPRAEPVWDELCWRVWSEQQPTSVSR